MTPSDSVPVKLAHQSKKALFFSIRLIWAAAVLFAVSFAWLILFVIFFPFVVLAVLINAFSKKESHPESTLGNPAKSDSSADDSSTSLPPLIFDRRCDVSKLFGCNTRSVRYRWQIFSSKLELIRDRFPNRNALDFGAGSLRDSYELTRLGFHVTSVDLDSATLNRYYNAYDWSSVCYQPTLHTEPLDRLLGQSFQLTIAFDVIEHLEDPAKYCRTICSLLDEGAFFFTIVPNKRSIFERYFKHSVTTHLAKGGTFTPGVPHLQFKSPSEWEHLFEQCGLKIVEHDMAIGFFVNDCWTGLLGLPLRLYVTPVIDRLAKLFGFRFDPLAFEERFCPPWLMEHINVLDQLVKRWFAPKFGWNLIVAEKMSSQRAAD